jgi:GMP synthase (glutamine-hydrolysing)
MADRLSERCPWRSTRFALATPSVIMVSNLAAEYGHADVKIAKVNSHVDRLFAGLGDEIPVFMSHFDKLISLPTVNEVSRISGPLFTNSGQGFVVIAATKNSEFAGIAHEQKPIFGLLTSNSVAQESANARRLGVQFHPELEHVRTSGHS